MKNIEQYQKQTKYLLIGELKFETSFFDILINYDNENVTGTYMI